MQLRKLLLATATGLSLLAAHATSASALELTIATVNNSDMIIMQELSSKWEEKTGNTLN